MVERDLATEAVQVEDMDVEDDVVDVKPLDVLRVVWVMVADVVVTADVVDAPEMFDQGAKNETMEPILENRPFDHVHAYYVYSVRSSFVGI